MQDINESIKKTSEELAIIENEKEIEKLERRIKDFNSSRKFFKFFYVGLTSIPIWGILLIPKSFGLYSLALAPSLPIFLPNLIGYLITKKVSLKIFGCGEGTIFADFSNDLSEYISHSIKFKMEANQKRNRNKSLKEYQDYISKDNNLIIDEKRINQPSEEKLVENIEQLRKRLHNEEERLDILSNHKTLIDFNNNKIDFINEMPKRTILTAGLSCLMFALVLYSLNPALVATFSILEKTVNLIGAFAFPALLTKIITKDHNSINKQAIMLANESLGENKIDFSILKEEDLGKDLEKTFDNILKIRLSLAKSAHSLNKIREEKEKQLVSLKKEKTFNPFSLSFENPKSNDDHDYSGNGPILAKRLSR